MGHYCVFVVTLENDERDIYEIMFPYQEFRGRGFRYAHEDVKDVDSAFFVKAFTIEEAKIFFKRHNDIIKSIRKNYPEEVEKRLSMLDLDGFIITNVIYDSLQDMMFDYCMILSKEKTHYGYYINLNYKYDWCGIGGRWDGFLLTKDGKNVNSCLVKDLNLKDLMEKIKDWDKPIMLNEKGLFEYIDRSDIRLINKALEALKPTEKITIVDMHL